VSKETLTHSRESIKTYLVKKVDTAPVMTGRGDDPPWKHALQLTEFHYPWMAGKPRPTSFQAVHDNEWLYCLFMVSDPSTHIRIHSNDKMEVVDSSRAEIFFKADDNMNPYYCLEIDPKGRVLDYKGIYHRNFDYDWSWPHGHLKIATSQQRDGYTIEVAISKDSLRDLGLLKSNVLQAGIFRADCHPVENGEPDFDWISWLIPDSATPDFHIPSSFGLLRLDE